MVDLNSFCKIIIVTLADRGMNLGVFKLCAKEIKQGGGAILFVDL